MSLFKEQETHGLRDVFPPPPRPQAPAPHFSDHGMVPKTLGLTAPVAPGQLLEIASASPQVYVSSRGAKERPCAGGVDGCADRDVPGSRMHSQGSYRPLGEWERAEWSRASGGVDTGDPCGSHGGQRLRDCPTTGPSSPPTVFNVQRLIAYSNSFSVGYRACEKPNDLAQSLAAPRKRVRASDPRTPHSFHLGMRAPGPGLRSPLPWIPGRTVLARLRGSGKPRRGRSRSGRGSGTWVRRPRPRPLSRPVAAGGAGRRGAGQGGGGGAQ